MQSLNQWNNSKSQQWNRKCDNKNNVSNDKKNSSGSIRRGGNLIEISSPIIYIHTQRERARDKKWETQFFPINSIAKWIYSPFCVFYWYVTIVNKLKFHLALVYIFISTFVPIQILWFFTFHLENGKRNKSTRSFFPSLLNCALTKWQSTRKEKPFEWAISYCYDFFYS